MTVSDPTPAKTSMAGDKTMYEGKPFPTRVVLKNYKSDLCAPCSGKDFGGTAASQTAFLEDADRGDILGGAGVERAVIDDTEPSHKELPTVLAT
jgi:hypothetical protein